MRIIHLIAFPVITVLLAGCASSRSGEVYSRDQARKAQTVQMGTVEFVKEVRIEGTKSGAGTVGGGVAGGFLGSTVGAGRGSVIGTVVGSIAGAVAGSVAEEGITRRGGLEITVKLDSGGVIAVTQEADVLFSVGDRVRVLTGADGTTRVEK
ncbi:MAG: glycine zipper 2TM domain-containing protein [Kiritimatiellales bacterium]